ncbi:hypothetical protein M404DRAFT_992745 [Pisolithus tinctorius Marx 270]|uniref:Uncharacterized protein n=1 Tax=Pisolithus tinctorius Marx 270 TaxID=870435 RepID=A0A0C3KUA3_PISTI|nr:hypothetical protein M404DRAFT_992745 [Pisolithus tinctorius Marx 270]
MGDIVAKASLDRASALSYYQKWIPSKNHKFPLSLQQVPQGHEKKLAIETNQVESIFLLTQGV